MAANNSSKRRRILAAMAATAAAGTAAAFMQQRLRPGAAPRLPSAVSDTTRRERRPNILLIVNDQMRHWLDLPSGLGLRAQERLRENGMAFQQFHANTTPCSPARATMYYGQHTQFTHMTGNIGAPPTFPELAEGLPSMGHLLRAQGYYTAYKGKWHLSHLRDDPGLVYGPYPSTAAALEPYGFADYNVDGDPHGATWTGYRYDGQIASNAVRWLEQQGKAMNGKQPWFLAVNFVNPHDVMYVSTGAAQQDSRLRADLLSPLSAPPAGGVYDQFWDLPLPPSFYRDDLADKPWASKAYVGICDMLYGHLDPHDEAAWRRYQSYYLNCIRDVDSHAQTVLDALQRLGLERDTIVIYTSDHGEMAGAHKLRQKGPFMYKENVRLPLIVRHPDGPRGASTDALGSHLDLLPTILGFAGVPERAMAEHYPYLRGVDLGAAAASPQARTRRDQQGTLFNYGVPLYADPDFTRKGIKTGRRFSQLTGLLVGLESGQFMPSLDNPALFRGIHDGRYKFARYFKPSDHHTPRDWQTLSERNQLELYDTHSDPHELSNLAASATPDRELLLRLNDKLNKLIAQEVGLDQGAELPGPAMLYRKHT